jgi:HK97 family phage prohead protease
MKNVIERRTFAGTVEFRALGDKLVAAGYAAMFNKISQNLGGFVEQVAPGAFTKTIQEQDIRALFNHDENQVLGRLAPGTLRLEEDGTGLAYEIDLPDTSAGRDVAKLLERQDVSGSSFGFRTIDDEWGETETGFPLRTLKQVSLRDVGPVTFPAYTDSTSALRSLAEARSLDLSTVVALADAGELRSVITDDFTPPQSGGGDGRETPTVVRRPSDWLL